MRLGILTSHPIQYQAPWFRALAKIVDLEVFFAHRQSAAEQGKAGFGVAFDWDVDLLCGYRHQFLKNVASRPGVDHFFGCDTPEVAEIIERLRDNESQDYQRGEPLDCGPRTKDQGTTCGQRSMASGQWSVVRGPSFDAFIVTGWHLKSYWQAVRACRRAGVPVLVRGDSQLHTPRSLLKRWAKELVHRVLLRQFAGFLTVGKRNREYLEHYGVPPEKIFFAPHFVDNEWFGGKAEIARKQKAEIRKEWGADDQALVALFVGKFQPVKRPLDLVEAASLLLEDRSSKREDRVSDSVSQLPTPLAPLRSLHLLFVGSGELEKELRAACDVRFDAEGASRDHATTDQGTTHHGRETADCGTNGSRLVVSGPVVRGQPTTVRPRATFAGFRNQSELPAYYAAADLIVLPSSMKRWPAGCPRLFRTRWVVRPT